ncbi:MAG: DUF3341 domain-containing protein [Chloroflexi bacterium]|nr:DUF3341 domain-containing protein [Chloroflexota bacterium]
MAKRPILGIFNDANAAADAGDGLKAAGVSENDYDFLTDAPYPEGAFGEREEKHRIYLFPFIGALLGLTSGIILTSMTQVAYPLVTGGKPILSLPPMAVVSYEGTMLGAILFTVLGIIFESRLPKLKMGLYDTRITEGYIGVLVNAEETQHDQVANVLNAAGAVDVKRESSN